MNKLSDIVNCMINGRINNKYSLVQLIHTLNWMPGSSLFDKWRTWRESCSSGMFSFHKSNSFIVNNIDKNENDDSSDWTNKSTSQFVGHFFLEFFAKFSKHGNQYFANWNTILRNIFWHFFHSMEIHTIKHHALCCRRNSHVINTPFNDFNIFSVFCHCGTMNKVYNSCNKSLVPEKKKKKRNANLKAFKPLKSKPQMCEWKF